MSAHRLRDDAAGACVIWLMHYGVLAMEHPVVRVWANIPPKSNRKDPICFSKHLYRARNRVERFFNKIKHYRRIATRYDKTAESFLAALKLVAVRIWLRDNESTS